MNDELEDKQYAAFAILLVVGWGCFIGLLAILPRAMIVWGLVATVVVGVIWSVKQLLEIEKVDHP